MLTFLFSLLGALYVLYNVLSSGVPRLFLVPPHGWQQRIKDVIEYPKPIYLKSGNKRSSYRRRLILSSSQPSFYTNFVNNKLKILPIDCLPENRDLFIKSLSDREIESPTRKLIYGFFHPYANNGGGGERVLWQAVKATLHENDKNIAVIYTTNIDAQPLDIISKVENKFQISNLDSSRITFIYLRRFSKLIDANYWKHFTLIGQLLGSFLLAMEAIFELSPDVWIDTIGLPGSYVPIHLILKIPIFAYVHYPIIQPDMFNKLKFKYFQDLFLFKGSVSDFKGLGKFFYWSTLYYFYTYLGSLVNITLANGSWTFNHLNNIWILNKNYNDKVMNILYPPCGTEFLAETITIKTNQPSEPKKRENSLLYIAQFRPEKRHSLILNEFKEFICTNTIPINKIPKIIFLGSCRTPDDTETLEAIKKEIIQLELSSYIELVVDCSYDTIVELLSTVKFGLNAMWNEHFGIGVVEYLSKGVIPLVHASAGPLLDIVKSDDKISSHWYNELGFFFKDINDPDFDKSIQNQDSELLNFNILGENIEYPSFSTLLKVIYIEKPDLINDSSLDLMRSKGSKLMTDKFSNKVFEDEWMKYIYLISTLEKTYREERRGNVESVY